MNPRPCILFLSCLVLTCGICLHAGARSAYTVGVYQSPKGFGLSGSVQRGPSDFHTLMVYADITGLPFGKTGDLRTGFKAVYAHPQVLGHFDGRGGDALFYLGPGCSLGRVRDLGQHQFGFCGALCACAGFRMECRGRLRLDIGICAELGLRMLRKQGNTEISLYRNGLLQTVLPQIRFEYAF